MPDYLLHLRTGHRILLLEMGMKSLNNIARQCKVVRPNFGAITNVGEAHVGSLGSLDTVVKAKQELINGMHPGGTLLLNADCTRSRKLSIHRFPGKVLTFGIDHPADIQGENVRYTSRGMRFDVRMRTGKFSCSIPTFGNHNVLNALAAIGICQSMGVTTSVICRGLAHARLPTMRLQTIRGKKGNLLINDAWNANPTAMKAGLSVLKHIAGRKNHAVAILGDMLELGRYTSSAHRDVGNHAARSSLSLLITYGRSSREIGTTAVAKGMDPKRVLHYGNRDALTRFLGKMPQNSVLYFKGSRKLRMEKIINELKFARR